MARKQKVILIIFGFIIVIMLLEIALRVTGFAYKNYRISNRSNEIGIKNDAIKILCLGDSFTFGNGAPKGHSYPEQLQAMLNNKAGTKYIVYNAGIGGQNSSLLFKELEKNIQKYKPNIALIMTGINNNSCFIENNYFLFIKGSVKVYLYRIDAFLSNIKVYRLLRSAMVTIRDNIENKIGVRKYRNLLKVKTSKPAIKDIDQELKEKAERYLESAKVYELEYKINLAIDECKKSIELNPHDDRPYYLLGFIYLHRFQGANQWSLAVDNFEKAASINPGSEDTHYNLFNAYYRIGENKKAMEELTALRMINPDNEMVNALLDRGLPEYGDMDVFKKTLKYDLTNIASLLKYRKIKLILLNYPGAWVNETLKEIVEDKKIPFIDNQLIFEQKRLSNNNGYKREDYFVEDGHCNENGYRIITENVYNALIVELESERKL